MLLGQQKITVVDAETQQPIPYAKLIFENSYRNSEANGEIIISENEKPIRIEAFGYEDFVVSDLLKVFLLKPAFNEIEKIEIHKPKFTKNYIIGSIKKNNTGFSAGEQIWSVVDLFKIENTTENLYIKKIKLPTEVRKKGAEATFNLIFYENENGQPSTEKFRNLVVKCKSGKNITEIDLSKKPIPFPDEGLFIGFEWIMNEENKYAYKVNIKHSEGKMEKKVNRIEYSPTFSGRESQTPNLYGHSSKYQWTNIFKNYKNFYALSIELELTN